MRTRLVAAGRSAIRREKDSNAHPSLEDAQSYTGFRDVGARSVAGVGPTDRFAANSRVPRMSRSGRERSHISVCSRPGADAPE